MPNRCNIYNCKGNYAAPYVKVFKFPTVPAERERWILACPNDPEKLRSLKQIFACKSHFTEFQSCRGGEQPTGPPSIFPGVEKSCLNQTNPQPRPTEKATSSARVENKKRNDELVDKIGSFDKFRQEIGKRYKYFQVRLLDDDLTLSFTDKLG